MDQLELGALIKYYQAKWAMKEHLELLAQLGLPVPPRNPDPVVTIRNEHSEEA
jgi:hypothetical protein